MSEPASPAPEDGGDDAAAGEGAAGDGRGIGGWIERILSRLSLRAQVAILITVAMLPVGVFAVAQGFGSYGEIKRLRQEAAVSAARAAGREERSAIREGFGALRALDALLKAEGDARDPERCAGLLGAAVRSDAAYVFAGVTDRDGMIRCGYPMERPVDVSDDPAVDAFFAAPRRIVTAKPSGAVSGQRVLLLTQPLRRDGDVAAALTLSLSSRYLSWKAGADELPPRSRFAIVTRDGRGVAESLTNASEDALPFGWLPPAEALAPQLGPEEALLEMEAANGEAGTYAVVPLYRSDVFAITGWPAGAVPVGLDWRQLISVLLPVLMWALAVAVAYFAVDQLALRHIVYLDRLVSAYGRSHRRLRAAGTREAPAEIAALGESFDRMASTVESREAALLETVREKDTLLREVYHRVKNNLQLIVSLLNLQIRKAENPRERAGLERLQERVQGLASVHQRIYDSDSMAEIRVDMLIADIAARLREGRSGARQSVELDLDLQPVTVSTDRAVPLALFATETIVNTFKHALGGPEGGRLRVELRRHDADLTLCIENTLAPGASDAPEEGRGVGSQLIEGFARQLRGRVEVERGPGSYRVSLHAPVEGSREGAAETRRAPDIAERPREVEPA